MLWITRCGQCHRRCSHAICQACWQQVRLIQPPSCQHCSLQLEPTQACCPVCSVNPFPFPLLAYGAYRGILKQLLYHIKYDPSQRLARELGRRAGLWLKSQQAFPAMLTAVPLHRHRQQERGFNQAADIARGMAEVLGIPYRELFVRLRPTQALAELTPAERTAMLVDAFALREPFPITPGTILLVDDIVTTGTTIRAVAACVEPQHLKLMGAFAMARA